jgi:hypothetical protein
VIDGCTAHIEQAGDTRFGCDGVIVNSLAEWEATDDVRLKAVTHKLSMPSGGSGGDDHEIGDGPRRVRRRSSVSEAPDRK